MDIMESQTYNISLVQWPCLLLDPCTQVAGSSQPLAVDNDGPGGIVRMM